MKKENFAGCLRAVFVFVMLVAETGLFSRRHHYEKANMYLAGGHREKAAVHYLRSVVLAPDSPDAYGGALAALEGKDYDNITGRLYKKAEKNGLYGLQIERYAQMHSDMEKYGITTLARDGNRVEMYNSLGQLIQTSYIYTTTSPWWKPYELFSYHPSGSVASRTVYDKGWWWPGDTLPKLAMYTYSESGVTLSETYYNKDTNLKTEEKRYDTAGRLLREMYYSYSERAEKWTDYTYDDAGRLLTEKYSGTEQKLVEYTYDETGRLLQITEKKPPDFLAVSVTDVAYDGDVSVFTENSGYKQTVTTCINGETVKIEHLQWSRTSLTDKTLKLIPERTEYYSGGRLIKEENYHHYSGRLCSIKYYSGEAVRREEIYEKDSEGVWLESVTLYDDAARVTDKTVFSSRDRLKKTEKHIHGPVEIYEEYNSLNNLVYRTTTTAGITREEFFSNTDRAVPLYTTERSLKGGTKTVHFPRADMTGSRPLTREETEQVNSTLTLNDYSSFHPLECFLCMEMPFGKPEEINLSSFVTSMANFGVRHGSTNLFRISVLNMEDRQELNTLKSLKVPLDYDGIETNGDIYYRVFYGPVDSLLKEYAGILSNHITNPDLPLHSGAYNWYYTRQSSWSSFICIGGEINDSWLKLYSKRRTRIFRREGDSFYIYAVINEDNSGKENIYTENKEGASASKKKYIPRDIKIDTAGQSDSYKRAAALYTEFLQPKVDAMRRDWQLTGSFSAIRYALVDLSCDGRPELVTSYPDPFAPYDVYMITGGRVRHIDTVGGYGGDGGVTVLPSGYIMGHMHKIDSEWYDFYWYNYDGSINEFHFGIDQDYYRDDVKYKVNGRYVSRREYIRQTGDYIRWRKNDMPWADVKWYVTRKEAEQPAL